MYEYFLFIILSAALLFFVFTFYSNISNYINRTVFYKNNIEEIKRKMDELDKEDTI
jgi:type II secretory pathway component PulJ